MQRVEDGKEVHEGQVDGPPGEEGEAPGEAQQHGDARHPPRVLQGVGAPRAVRVLPQDATQLHHDHHEHDEVEEEDDAEVCHHRHVEGHIVA